ncbi:MAG: tail fiber protein [Vicinamibacterales bacterium]
MGQPYVGEIILVAFNFAPAGWAFCQGQLLPISQNDTLFQLIGTTYGGDGQTNFALPDLRGRVPIGPGQGIGLQNYNFAEPGGEESETLTLQQLASHGHAINSTAVTAAAKCRTTAGNLRTPVGAVPAVEAAGVTMPYSDAAPDAVMYADPVNVSGSTAAAGSAGPHDNRQPYLALNYCIALSGIFPSPF